MSNEIDLQMTTDLKTSQRTQESAWAARVWVYYFLWIVLAIPLVFLTVPTLAAALVIGALLLAGLAAPFLVNLRKQRRLNRLRAMQLAEFRHPSHTPDPR